MPTEEPVELKKAREEYRKAHAAYLKAYHVMSGLSNKVDIAAAKLERLVKMPPGSFAPPRH